MIFFWFFLDERQRSRKSPWLLVVEMGMFPLPHQFVSSAASADTTQKRNSVKAPSALWEVFFPSTACSHPPFPLIHWHVGRNICYYSCFLTVCTASVGSCYGRKQLSGKQGRLRTETDISALISNGLNSKYFFKGSNWLTTRPVIFLMKSFLCII